MGFFSIAVWMSVGHFVYQALASGHYMVAAERSFFQCMAVFACWALAAKQGGR